MKTQFFFFFVFRVVQGEAKTPKIKACCRAKFVFLHAPKFGTFRGKWRLDWVFKTWHFFCLALDFLINSILAISLHVPSRNCKNRCDLERRTVQKKTNFASMFGNLFSLKISLSLFLSQKLPMNIRKKFDFQQAMSIKSGVKTKN